MHPASYCQIASFVIGIAKVCYMAAPVGQCDECCARDALDIQYKLFTRVNPTEFQIIPVRDLNGLRNTVFDTSWPTVIYIMGFSDATDGASTTLLRDYKEVVEKVGLIPTSVWMRLVGRTIQQESVVGVSLAYLSSGDYNFIAVDWARLVAFPWYVQAVQNSRYMGNKLASFIRFLETAGVPASSLHVIGFSLGAEAAGFAGKRLRTKGIMIGRITGLDPAYPGYSLTDSSGHLAKGDAIFVDVLHTNPGVFGFPTAIGDVDFYANPGSWVQPGCWVDQLIKNKEIRFIYGCSHIRAWRLYAESIRNPRGFPATLCRDWKSATRPCQFQIHGYMGFPARHPMAGKMYLETNEKPPFAKNGP